MSPEPKKRLGLYGFPAAVIHALCSHTGSSSSDNLIKSEGHKGVRGVSTKTTQKGGVEGFECLLNSLNGSDACTHPAPFAGHIRIKQMQLLPN